MSYSTADINNETDLRFWATTHYKVGQKLDPNNALDKAMVPVWVDANRRVRAEAAAGTLSLTYKDPGVQQALTYARDAHDAAATAVEAADDHAAGATGATLPAVLQAVRDLGAQASDAIKAGNRALSDVATQHPPTINPVVAQQAAQAASQVTATTAADQVAKAAAIQAGAKAADKLAQHVATPAAKSGGGGGGVAIAVGIGVVGLMLVVKK